MSFKGIVTRKEKDTGVTLEAKIVTPSKKKATKYQTKVKVKKTGLTDYECCVIDQNTIREKITKRQNLNELKEDIAFIYSGENGTIIEYSIENVGEPKLTDYLDSNGKIIKRPVYGTTDVTGYISMTVKKGVESITTRLPITIESISSQEALQSLVITDAILWNSIKGKNGNYTEDDTSGHKNVFYPLNLISNSDGLQTNDRLAVEALTNTPITFTWSITDNAFKKNSSIITKSRISDDGSVFSPEYKDACTLLDSGFIDAALVSGSAFSKRIRIGELTLKATMQLGENTKDIIFNCSTCSKYITNEEVSSFVSSKIDIMTNSAKLKYRTMHESTTEILTIPATATTEFSIGLVADSTATEEYSIDELELAKGEVNYTFKHRICEYNTTNTYDDTDNIFTSGLSYEDSTSREIDMNNSKRWPIIIDTTKVKALNNVNKKKFTIETVVITSRYTNGESSNGGAPEQTNLYCNIELDDSLI